jgi:hypothetical protein
MQTEGAGRTEGVNAEKRPEGTGDDEGPTAPQDGSTNVPDVPDAVKGNQGRAYLGSIRRLNFCKLKLCLPYTASMWFWTYIGFRC